MNEIVSGFRLARGATLVLGLALVSGLAQAGSITASSPASARSTLRQIEQSVSGIRVELRSARVEGNPLRARCVSDKLSEAHAQLRLARDHVTEISTPVVHQARRHGHMVEVARERTRELAEEARRCGAGARGPSAVRVVTPRAR